MIFLKVETTHVTYVSYQAQLEIYTLWECQKREKIRFREKNLNLNPKSGLKKKLEFTSKFKVQDFGFGFENPNPSHVSANGIAYMLAQHQ